ncbi:MAG: alpha/beta fold hydrolase [Chitinophaga sp.]|uniref:alpha/beta fold hydrolase n=1 Tax=Chitinophaga sp. TaxID=1869181 RepID=UPI001AFF0082|nr:alpha/beta fold hydrolase [Chitinophaga sp.]MBO9730887.1 alpha/beta fold hydrolase [Chitinophaga sp.]
MKRILFFVLLLGSLQAVRAQQQPVVSSFFEQIGRSNWTGAMQYMAPVMKEKLTADMLKGVWQQIEQTNGKWEALTSQKVVRDGNHFIVTAENNFERTTVIFRLTLDSANRLVGFFITGSRPKQVMLNTNETTDTVHAADGTVLYGTLTLPEGQPHSPVVLIIAGSGPTDRNGNSLFLPATEGFSYQQLAAGLAAHGIASLRYDKRGTGQSTASNKPLTALTLDDFVADAAACVDHLERSGQFANVSVIGHSEGGVIGLALAGRQPMKCLIALSTPGEAIDKVLLEQLKPRLADSLYQQSVSILEGLRENKTPDRVPADLNMFFNKGTFGYWKSAVRFDPCAMLALTQLPVLVVGGAADVQVTPAQVTMLQDCKPGTQLVLIEGMTHALKNNAALSPDKKTPLPLSPELVPALANFLRQ